MDTSPDKKRLATIVALDMAGFSSRTETDESAAVTAVAALRERVGAAAAGHGGRIFNAAGDGFMLEFDAASEALLAALELLTQAPADAPPIRVGVHVGEVAVTASGDLLGHGVNVAARLEALAQPGMAIVSRAAADLVRGELQSALVPRGRVALEKMDETIDVLALDPTAKPGHARRLRRRRTWMAAALAGAAAAAAVFVVLFAAGQVGARRSSEDMNAVAREVMSQLVSSASASPTLPDGAYAAVLALERSDAPADQAAIAFLRVGEISRAVATLEQFAADLERRGARSEAAAAYVRAANVAQFLDAQRTLRDARRAFDLEPTSLEGFEMVFMGLRLVEGAPAADAFAAAVIARQSGRTRLRAFARTVVALHAATVRGDGTSDAARNAVAMMESDVRAFPNDDLLQAYAERVRGGAATLRNDVRAALAHAAEARQRYRRAPGHELNGQTVWIRALELSGDWDRAWAESRAFIEERERLGAPPSLYLLGNACFIGQNLNLLAEAQPICSARARADRAETEKLLAIMAASEGRVQEALARLAASRQLRPNTDAYFASYEADIYALAGDFEAAEERLATFRRLTLADSTLAAFAASDLARQLRTLGVREVNARRLRQGCAMLAEAAHHYRSYGADPGVDAMERAQREARCAR